MKSGDVINTPRDLLVPHANVSVSLEINVPQKDKRRETSLSTLQTGNWIKRFFAVPLSQELLLRAARAHGERGRHTLPRYREKNNPVQIG